MLKALMASQSRLLSAVTGLEASLVIEGRYGAEAGADLELLIYAAGIRIVPFDARQCEVARTAWRKYGKGRHPASLNLGDCCVYAVAKVYGEPVLCKGDDFQRTDVAVVRL